MRQSETSKWNIAATIKEYYARLNDIGNRIDVRIEDSIVISTNYLITVPLFEEGIKHKRMNRSSGLSEES